MLTTARALAAGAVLAIAGCAGGALAGAAQTDACTAVPAATHAARATAGFAAAAARNAPAVVSVVVIRARRDPQDDLESFDFFQALSGLPLGGKDEEATSASLERSSSSGFIISAEGHILTSAHAVFDARQTWVITADGRRWQAAVVGLDRNSDVALLKVEAAGLPVVRLASSVQACPGSWVAALGAPFGFDRSVTVGVVSAYPRYLPGGGGMPLIQTDVVLNPGSSGGPLFDADGLVVGMNSMIFSANGIYIGVSFTLPIDRVMRIANDLRSGTTRGYIGLRTQPVTRDLARAFGLADARGALVTRVAPGGPAEQAGLRTGDIVVALDGAAVPAQFELEEAVAGIRPGVSLGLRVWRQQTLRQVSVTVGVAPRERPPQIPAAAAPEARLGLSFAPVKFTAGMPAGVYVEEAAGPALLAGIEPGDRITAVNGMDVVTPGDFDAALHAIGSASVVAVLVTRGAARLYIAVVRQGL